MKTLSLMLALFVLLLTVPVAAAQEAGPAVYGYFNDPTLHGGRVPMYFSQPASPADAESRPAGLAQPAPAATLAEAAQACPGVKGSIAWRACAYSAPVIDAAAKPAGLAQPAPAAKEGRPIVCGHANDPLVHAGRLPACLGQLATELQATAKPSGLAQLTMAPGVDPDQRSDCVGLPERYYIACMREHDTTSAPKSAGLVQPAAAVAEETFVPCGFGERLDPLALACQRPAPTTNAAAKPAGLAQPAPTASSIQGWPGCPYGYDHNPACQSGPDATANAAAAKPAGLAQPALTASSIQGWPGCPYGYDHNPACQSGPDASVQAASKPAGLAQPAPATAEQQSVPCGPELASATVSARLSCQ